MVVSSSNVSHTKRAARRATTVALLLASLVTIINPAVYNNSRWPTSPTRLLTPPPSGSGYGYSRQWGSLGGISSPNGVAVDPSGNMFVADGQNFGIGKMSSNGTLLSMWGSYGVGVGKFTNPLDVAVDTSGNVFVTDSANNNVTK